MRRRGSASASSRDEGSTHSSAMPERTTLAGQPSVIASSLATKSGSCGLPDRWRSTSADLVGVEEEQVAGNAREGAGKSKLLEAKAGSYLGEDDEVDGLGAVLEEVAEHLVHADGVHRLVVVVEDEVCRGGR